MARALLPWCGRYLALGGPFLSATGACFERHGEARGATVCAGRRAAGHEAVIESTSLRSREHLPHVLAEAAELEHNLLCGYLYAAFSLKRGKGKVSMTPNCPRCLAGAAPSSASVWRKWPTLLRLRT